MMLNSAHDVESNGHVANRGSIILKEGYIV